VVSSRPFDVPGPKASIFKAKWSSVHQKHDQGVIWYIRPKPLIRD